MPALRRADPVRGHGPLRRPLPACGLDFAAFNVGDGPAAFLTLILGTIVDALAIALELTLAPAALAAHADLDPGHRSAA